MESSALDFGGCGHASYVPFFTDALQESPSVDFIHT